MFFPPMPIPSLDIDDNLGTASRCLILLFTFWIGFLTAEISSHKYSPYISSSMPKIVHISNINWPHYTIFHSVHGLYIEHHFFCRFKVQQPLVRLWGLNKSLIFSPFWYKPTETLNFVVSPFLAAIFYEFLNIHEC